ncbi:DnaT-like ssDNA-binding protein [Collimonas humicola]|uniref:DnaT-like ssDNA-binding protein n=1 Tax=Collimonas humicola TaxID=2825886 RepID=UPI001B8AE7BA|nr:DnaT-like ssDNA-binding protein [Collimonas humicola]
MALVVEDGTGMPAAESYISTADADTYHANRGNAAWMALATPVKEQMLRLAADYMTEAYRGRWKGYRSQNLQALDWPRKSVILTDMAINYMIQFYVIPNEVKNAQAELAARAAALGTPLAPDLEQGIISESVAGAVSTVYDRFSPQHTRYRQVDMILRPLLAASGAMSPLVRT